MLITLVFTGLSLVGHTSGTEPQVAAPIRIHVGIPARDGFVDASKGVTDSVRDVWKRLEGLPGVTLSASPDDADLRVWIVDRGVGSEAYGTRATITPYFRGAQLQQTTMYANTYWVAAILEVGEYRKELVGDYTHGYVASFGAWTEAARELVTDLQTWVDANRRRLVARRGTSTASTEPGAPTMTAPATALALATANPDAVWAATLPGTVARVQPQADGSLRLTLEGTNALSATLVPDGPGRFVGVADVRPTCAIADSELNLIDEGGAWTVRTVMYDCEVSPAAARRTVFRLLRQ